MDAIPNPPKQEFLAVSRACRTFHSKRDNDFFFKVLNPRWHGRQPWSSTATRLARRDMLP